MTVGVPKPLRLLAESAEDFRILSGLLQDSLLVPQQLRWQKKLGRFSMPLNRFCWETVRDGHETLFFRVASELKVEGVVQARHKGFDSLLSAHRDTPGAAPGTTPGTTPGAAPGATLDAAPDATASHVANLLACELAEGPCLRFTFSQGLELCLWGGAEEKDGVPSSSSSSSPSSRPSQSLASRGGLALRASLTDTREVQRTDKLPSHFL